MSGDGRTILVVDDDADVLAICERLLGASGYRVVCVAESSEALRRIHKEQPVLVLLDLAMPDVGGLALTQALRADPEWRAVPIIAISALGDMAAADALAAGCTAFRTKPLGARALLDVVNRFLGCGEGVTTASQEDP